MTSDKLRENSFILYKTQPGRISQIHRKKIDIKLRDGQTLSVRPKDVTLLHPGPLRSLNALKPQEGEIKTAWELLAGETTTLAELTELAYGEFTPATAWAAWQWVDDGLYFSGEPAEIQVHTAAAVAEEEAARAAKAEAERRWNAFLERVEAGTYAAEDDDYLTDVELLATGQSENSRVLRALGRSETPQNAHALLLAIGYWDERANPYPQRFNVVAEPPTASLPDLPDEERRDLTHLQAFAIDDEDSRDPDDALSWEDGRLWVHVADVAALIRPDSPADLEARDRGANLYLPEGTVHMLPHAATALLALGLADVSPALSFGIDLNPDGTIREFEVVPSRVRVTRLSYTQAEEQLDTSPLREMAAVARAYGQRRLQNGAIEIDLPEVKVLLVAGEVVIKPLPRLGSRDLVREAMLMTGEGVGRFALEHEIAMPFTVQETHEEVSNAAQTPSENFALRRMMKRSEQQSTPGRHAGLGMEVYVQATSPLRRYLDLVVHQQLRRYLWGARPLDAAAVMARVGAANAIAGDVRRAERMSIEHWQHVYLLRHPEWQGKGVIVDKRGARDVILIPELGLETHMYSRRDNPLDETVTLAVEKVNLAELEATFVLV